MIHMNKLVRFIRSLGFYGAVFANKHEYGIIVGHGCLLEINELTERYNAELPYTLSLYFQAKDKSLIIGYWILNIATKELIYIPEKYLKDYAEQL